MQNNSIKHCKRVGMLLHSYYLRDIRVRREAEALTAEGIEVHVVCIQEPMRPDGTKEPKQETVNGVHIYRLPFSKKRGGKLRYFYEYTSLTFLGLLKLTMLHFKNKFNAVHIHNMPDILVIAGLITKWTGASLILDIHDPMNELFQANYRVGESNFLIRAIKFQEWLCYKIPDHLITVSHTMAENISKKSGRPVNTIKVVHNFPDLKMFPIRENMQKWPRNGKKFALLYSGTVTEHYGLDMAVNAVALAADDIPNIVLQILGHGNRLQQVLSLANELGIRDRVEHLGQVNVEAVKGIMAEADVGISVHRGGVFGDLYFSNKVIEYMTQGLPVISSHTYTFEKYVPQDTIFYFEPDNVESLVKQILLIYNDPILVKNKINNAKKLITKYNWQVERQNLISFYKQIDK